MSSHPSIDTQISPINNNATGSRGNSPELVDNKNDPGLQDESMNIDPLIDNNGTISLGDSPTIFDTNISLSDSPNDPLESDIQIPPVTQIPPTIQLPAVDNATPPGLPEESTDIINPQSPTRNSTTNSLTDSDSQHPLTEFINSEYTDTRLEKFLVDLT
jgi:hypothetical protein